MTDVRVETVSDVGHSGRAGQGRALPPAGEPDEAQSICEDVLHVDPSNFDAVRTLILALTVSFPNHDGNVVTRAQELVARLPSEYERAYYAGLVAERRQDAALAWRTGPRASRQRIGSS